MLRLLIVCNASTDAHRRSAFAADEPLDAKGTADAVALAPELPSADRSLTSPTLRARQTAERLGLRATEATALRDIDYGRWAGMTVKEVGDRHAADLALWLKDPELAPHGGESIASAVTRTHDFLASQSDRSGVTIAVTHPPIARACVIATLGAPASSFWKIDAGPLTQVLLTSDGKRWQLRSIRN